MQTTKMSLEFLLDEPKKFVGINLPVPVPLPVLSSPSSSSGSLSSPSSPSSPSTPSSPEENIVHLGCLPGKPDIKLQMKRYGAARFSRGTDGKYTCFFQSCGRRMANNFSRHIHLHELKGDKLAPIQPGVAIELCFVDQTANYTRPSLRHGRASRKHAVLHSEMQGESPTASLKDIASIILEGYSTNH